MTNKVLVVDDELDLVEILTEYLERNGFEIVGSADNGQKAFEMYEKYNPDYVIMDMMMPEYDGVFGMKKIKEADSSAKVIALSASHSTEIKNEALKLEPMAFFEKPCKIEKIVDLMNEN